MDNPYGDPLARLRSKGSRSARDVVRAMQPPPQPPRMTRIYVFAFLILFIVGIVPKLLDLLVRRLPARGSAQTSAPAEAPDATVLRSVPAHQEPEGAPDGAQDLRSRLAAEIARLQGVDPNESPSARHPAVAEILRLLDTEATDAFVAGRVDPKLTGAALLREPDRHRGAFVRLRGPVRDSFAVDRPAWLEERPGHNPLEQVFMEEHPGGRVLCVYFVNKDRGIVWRTSDKPLGGGTVYPILDWIEVEGVYLRPYEFESRLVRDGKAVRNRAALIVARSVRIVPPPAPVPDQQRSYQPLVIVAVGLAVGVMVVGAIFTRRYGGRMPLRMAVARARRNQETKPPGP
jgi:hypothetical protein